MFQCHFLVIYTTANLDSAADLLTWLHQGFIKRWITHEIEKTITINRGRTKGSTHWDRCGLEHQQLRPHRAQQVQLLCLYHLQDLFHHEHCQDQQDLSELMS